MLSIIKGVGCCLRLRRRPSFRLGESSSSERGASAPEGESVEFIELIELIGLFEFIGLFELLEFVESQ